MTYLKFLGERDDVSKNMFDVSLSPSRIPDTPRQNNIAASWLRLHGWRYSALGTVTTGMALEEVPEYQGKWNNHLHTPSSGIHPIQQPGREGI